MNLTKHTQGEFLTHPPTPCKAPSSPGPESVFFPQYTFPSICPCCYGDCSGWANVQQQFDRLVHFEYKPHPRKTLCFKCGVFTKSACVSTEEWKESTVCCPRLWAGLPPCHCQSSSLWQSTSPSPFLTCFKKTVIYLQYSERPDLKR